MFYSHYFKYIRKSIQIVIAAAAVAFIVIIWSAYYQKRSLDRLEAIPADDNGPITIGAIIPLSGDVAAVGLPIRKAAELALSEINQAGGIDGRQLKMEVRDGRCDAREAVNAAETFINIDHVPIIFAGGCSSETLAVAPLAERAKVILFSSAATSPEITTAGEYVFRNAPSDASQGMILAEAAFNRGFKKMGILQERKDYTVGIGNVFQSRFTELGGSTETQIYESDAMDVKKELTSLGDWDMEALLFIVQSPVKADMILNELSNLKLELPLFTNDVALGADRFTDEGRISEVEGLMAADLGVSESNSLYQEFIRRYQEIYQEDVNFPLYAALSYDAIYLLRDAMLERGATPDAIKNYLVNVKNRPGASGVLTIDANGDPTSGHVLKQMIKGSLIEVTVERESL